MTCYIKESIRCDISKVVGDLVKPFANSVCDSVTSHKQRHILPTFESCLFFFTINQVNGTYITWPY